MASNNQSRHYQMPGAIPTAEREDLGYNGESHVRMMDNVAAAIVDGSPSKPAPYLANSEQERPAADTTRAPHFYSQDGSNDRRDASSDVPASRDRHRGLVQQARHTDQPRQSSHGERKFNNQSGVRFHPYSRHLQPVPPKQFGIFGNTYPTPPVAWKNDSDSPLQNAYQLPRPQPPQQTSQYGTSEWHGDPAEPAIAQRFAATSNAPSPYAAYTEYVANASPYSQPEVNVHRNGQRLQVQPSHRGSRRPTPPIVEDKVEDGEESSDAEEDDEAGERQEVPTTKGSKKSENVSKAKKKVIRGLTRMNADGELLWLATVNSEGILAVRHDDIRPQLIDIAEEERIALGVENERPDEPGPGEHNVNSFFHKHVAWGPDREDRPEIVFDWEEDKEKNPRPIFPGYMYWEEDGKKYIVLDPHDNPVNDWDIPSTIASNIPGYKIEALRRDNMSLGHKDFWARMPSQINVGTEDETTWAPELYCLCSWTKRKKTLIIKAGLKKLYGNKLQNNSVRAFGRDLTTREIKEIKKGDKAVFPIKGDVVPATREASKRVKSKIAAKPRKPKGNAKAEKAQSRKREHDTDNEGQSSEEEAPTQARSRKRVRHKEKEDSIAAEIDDLVMFEESPIIVDQADTTRRYSLRSTRKGAKVSRRIETIEELSGESSADEEYEDGATQRYSLRKTRKVANARENGSRVEESSSESSAVEEDDYAPAQPSYPLRWIQTDGESHRERDKGERASRQSSVETDDEEILVDRFPFRRIPRAGEVGGKSKGPSWLSSAEDQSQGTDYRHTAIPVSIGGSIHYATYEGLISNGPAPSLGGSDTLPQRHVPETSGESLAQDGLYPPQPHAFDVMMSMPLFEERSLEEEDTPLQAHRKRVRDFLGDEEAEAHAPPSKRLRTEHPVLSRPGSGTHGSTSNVPPQIDQPSKASPTFHAQPSQTRKQDLEAEWAQVFEQTFIDLGYRSVNYSEVPPWNDDEVQSLVDALLPTREVYYAWIGEPTPETDSRHSYRAQYDTIFWEFQNRWRQHRSNEPLPILTGVMHWGRSVDDWEAPSKDSIYYEAFRKGHRAPRGADGNIIDLSGAPGPKLEDAYRQIS